MDINNLSPSQLSLPPESSSASNVAVVDIGAQISNVQGVPDPVSFPVHTVSEKVDSILIQLTNYPILPDHLLTQRGDLLASCQPDEKQAVWWRGLDSCNWRECMQLFIDSGCMPEVVNCCDGDGYNAAMRAVEKNNVKMLSELLKIDEIELNKPFPSFDGDTLLIRSVKSDYTAVFNLLVEHPDVNIYGCDGDGVTARDNANSLGNKFMADKLSTREVQVAYLHYMEEHQS
jgi:ankyrin repeat protein